MILFRLKRCLKPAVYEPQEVCCAFNDYLKHADGMALRPEDLQMKQNSSNDKIYFI